MAEREQPRALVLLRIVADGLRDPIRHVKYPDEERCARCGGKWPCPNGAFDELREEIKRLACDAQLQQAQEELGAAKRAGIAVSGKLLEAVTVGEQLARDYDVAIERAEAAEETVGRYNDQWKAVVRGLEEQRDEAIKRGVGLFLAHGGLSRRWYYERGRAEAAEALVEDLVKALTQVRDEMVTCTEWREDDPLYRIADDILAHVEAPAQRGAP